MAPEHAREFGGGLTETTLSPIVLVALVIATILIVVLPRKYAVLPLLFVGILVPIGQAIVVGGVHFFVLRIVILAGLIQLFRGKAKEGPEAAVARFNGIDSAFTWSTVIQAVAVIVLFREVPALINQAGDLIDMLGPYFLLRCFLRTEEDSYRALKLVAFISLILAVCMAIEQVKYVNVFGYIGGALAVEMREGKVRSQGPFLHTLTAGCFAATLVPLMLMLWKSGKAKFIASLGIIAVTIMTLAAHASTTLLAYAAGLLGIGLWPMRRKMRAVRWGIVVGLVGLQLVMKAPFWYAIAHVDLTGSSSGYQRAMVVDQFIRHFWDWWLIGVKDTGSWGWFVWDTQNQFVMTGETGGLAALIFFILMICRCFGRIGGARKAVEADREKQWPLWLLGAALFAHVTAFFGVNYFDQSKVNWMMLLAMISAFTAPLLAEAKKPVKAELVPAPIGAPEAVGNR